MPESVLIIDDERAIAQLTGIWVRAMGHKPVLAFDGREGLAAAVAYKPKLILLDVRMPCMDGFEVNCELKRIPEVAEIPVIFLSAHAQESARQFAIANGAVAFLSKPYDARDLGAAIAAAFDRAQSRQVSQTVPVATRRKSVAPTPKHDAAI